MTSTTMKRRPKDEEKGAEASSAPRKKTSEAASSSSLSMGNMNWWIIAGVVGWFLVVYKGAQLTKKHGLHYPVANYLGIGLGASPIIPGLAYTILSEKRKKLLVCGDDGYCSEVDATSENVRNSCFSVSEIYDSMDDKGGLTTSRIFYFAYVCPGRNYGKWLSYTLENQPVKKALRLKLFEKKYDASPWRLYKDKEGHKLQCFLDGPGKDHWIGIHKETGDSLLVQHSDSVGPHTRHSAFIFAMIADGNPSSRRSYAVFHESMKGFLTCDQGICRVSRKRDAVLKSCWVIERVNAQGVSTNDHYNVRHDCPGEDAAYLSTVETDGKVHVGLSMDKDEARWRIVGSNGTGAQITLMSGEYKGYQLGPDQSSAKEFYFVRRVELYENEVDEGKEPVVEHQLDIEKSESAKYSTNDYKFLGCYQDKWDRDLPKGPRKFGFTLDSCKKFCKGFLYMGMQSSSWCCCGNSYGKHGSVDSDKCKHDDNGKEVMTGGSFTNAVYELR